ncbi:FG-GAP repeat domain-containing protein [Zobellia nedashkovskayae]
MKTKFRSISLALFTIIITSCQDSIQEDELYSDSEELSSTSLTGSAKIFNSYQNKQTNYGSITSNDFLLGDINGDSKVDLVKIGTDGAVSIALGNSSGRFNSYHYKHTNYGGIRSNDFLLADINGDNKADLVKIGTDGAVSIALGNSSGRFNGYHYKHTNYGGIRSNDFLLADINGDNKADLVKIGTDGAVSIALGNSSGRFNGYHYKHTNYGGIRSNDFLLADINGDNKADLVKIGTDGAASIALGNSLGRFNSYHYKYTNYGGIRSNDFLLADCNNDNKADLVKIGNDGVVSVALGNSSGKFNGYYFKHSNYGSRNSNNFLLGDLNGNDKGADLIKIGNDGSVSIALSKY